MRLCSCVLFVLAAAVLWSEQTHALDRVVMKDGSIVEGQILKTRFMHVFITTADGNRTISMNDVERIERGVAPGSTPVRTAGTANTEHDGKWEVRVTPARSNRLKNTTKPYDDTITITNGKLMTTVGRQYGFPAARCTFTSKGKLVLVTASLGNPRHGTSVYNLTISGSRIAGTQDWGKMGEDGKPKKAKFAIAGKRVDPAPERAKQEKSSRRTVAKVPPKPPAPTAEELARRKAAVAALREAIMAKVKAGSRPRFSFKLGSTSLRGTVVDASDAGLKVRGSMGTMQVAWRGVTDSEVEALARACGIDPSRVGGSSKAKGRD